MPVPDYQTFMLPLLEFCGKAAKEVPFAEALEALAAHFSLTDEDRNELVPSGQQTTFENRLSWAATYLCKAGLLVRPKRANLAITERGRQLLAENLPRINVGVLMRYPEFLAFRQRRKHQETDVEERRGAGGDSATTPSKALQSAYARLKKQLADELLDRLMAASPTTLKRCVVDLLAAMGYGGSRAEAAKAIAVTGDGGICGTIKLDRLGLDAVYVEAKRWDGNPVDWTGVKRFADALHGQQANKGVFIAASGFTEDAKSYVSQIGSKIVLLDGKQLTDYMIEYKIGVSTVLTYPVKRVDSDYFDETF